MAPLIARDREAADVQNFINSSHDGSVGLIVEGEAGIGKSTLWLDALQRARDVGFRVLMARASAAESVLAYATLADLLADVDPDTWADLPAPQRQGLAAALLDEYDVAAPMVDQRAVGAALRTVLTRLADKTPVLVAIDDVQWIDASSAAAVAFAARRAPRQVAWLCTERNDDAVGRPTAPEFDPPGGVRRIRLRPLTVDALHDVITAQLGRSIARPAMRRIHQMSGGNPFYALELAQEVDRRGPADDGRLPASLAELTRLRIGRVDDDTATALLAIASLAVPTVALVADATGVLPHRLVERLAPAEANGIIVIDGNRIRFTHPLLAHAVRTGATPSLRRAMHRRLAALVTEPELRARHLALADPVGEPETLAALDAAADIARERTAPAAAAELLDLAIGLGGVTLSRRTRLAQCLFDAGDPRRAREQLEVAIAEAVPGPNRAEALQQLALVRLHSDSFVEAAELGRRALADSADAAPALRAGILTGLAFAEVNAGAIDTALTTIDDAVEVAERSGSPEQLARALSMRAMLHFMRGDGINPGALDPAVTLEERSTPIPVAFRPSVHKALLLAWTGEFESAQESLTSVGERCIARGEEGEMSFVAFHLVLIDIWRGDLRRAAVTAGDALVRARQLGGDAPLFIALTVCGAVAAYAGRADDARRDLSGAIEAAQRSNSVRLMEWTITMLAFLELSLGNHEQALMVAEPMLPMARNAPDCSEIIAASFVPDAAEAMIALGRLEEAEPLVESLERNGDRLDRAWTLAVAARCRALLSAARGDVTAGVAHAHLALTHHDRIAMPFERARTLLVLGRMERRLRHWRRATLALTEAHELFEAVGTPLWAARAHTELDRRTVGRPRSQGLTPAEQRVAELAASGMTNQTIAATLFIARKTVEVNLSRAYRKLGVRSRIELYHVMNGGSGP